MSGDKPPEIQGMPLALTLLKMMADDDTDSFHITFEKVATASQWPLEKWAIRLAVLLKRGRSGSVPRS